jgi:anti-sigma factor RsiW
MNDDDLHDLHDLSGAYAVDAVDEAERARFEAHLTECSRCRDEVASLLAAAGELSLESLTPPPPSLRASVLQQISSERPLPPVVDAPSAASLEGKRAAHSERSRQSPSRWLAGIAAAAAIVTGGVVWHPWSPVQEQRNVQLTATQQVLRAKDAERFQQKIGDATATVVRSASLGKAVIVTANMPGAPAGKVYELWLQQGQKMVKAGFMTKGPSNTVLLEGNAATAAGVGITVEPDGGSVTPSLPPVALITFA